MIPSLKVVTATVTYTPAVDLAAMIRRACEGAWRAGGGSQEKLHLALRPLRISVDRAALLSEAVGILFHAGLSPGFSLVHGRVGVHLWLLDRTNEDGILLIADDGIRFSGEPVTDEVNRARHLIEQANCYLVWHPAAGRIWRIHIPHVTRVGSPLPK